MIDIKILRSDPERVRESLRRRGSELSVDHLLNLDEQHRKLLADVEKDRARQNAANREIAEATGERKQNAIAEMKQVSDRIKEAEARLFTMRRELDEQLADVPNLVHPDAPLGSTDESNVVLRQVGDIPRFDFEARDHLSLGEDLDILDVVRASKISGTRFGILKREAAILEFALLRYALDLLIGEGFVPVVPPILVRREVLFGMGFFPSEESQAYSIPQDDLFLAGTSEAPLAGMHMDETLAFEDLPVRYAGFSSCFRREAGTYGKDTRGIIRVHQFDKVEMFVICAADESDAQHQRILELEERIFASLGITYRVVDVCAGELGAPYSRKFDLEAWLPGAKRWLEVTSCSNALDYQARRLNLRAKHGSTTEFVHTLNGTGVAVGRTIVALLENHQQSDGSISIPEALRPYTGFEVIKK